MTSYCSLLRGAAIVAGLAGAITFTVPAAAHDARYSGSDGWGCGAHHAMGPGMMGPGQGMMGSGQGTMGLGHGMMGPGQGMMAPGQGMIIPPGMGMGAARVATLDDDRDGQVSADEAAAAVEKRFQSLDTNGNDEIDTAERGGDAVPGRQQPLAGYDSDGDGNVSRAEFFQAHRAAFEQADENGDGQVTPWEYRAAIRG